MDKVKHELIKTYLKENENTGTISLSTPALWMDSTMKHYLWMVE